MTDTVISAESTSKNSITLFFVAKDACERLKSLDSSTSGGNRDALVAIVFSAMSLEAFLNELPESLCMIPELTVHNPPQLSSYVGLAKEVEANKGTITEKYLLAYSMLSGRPCAKGESPYQDFSSLIDVRNELVHAKPNVVSSVIKQDGTIQFGPNEKIVDKLRSKGILDLSKPTIPIPITDTEGVTKMMPMNPPYYFHDIVATRAAAHWACNTVADVVNQLVNLIPDSHNKAYLQWLSQRFGRIS